MEQALVAPCTLHEPPADIVLTRLVAPDPNAGAALRDAALDLVAELFPVARPIAADAWLDTWSRRTPTSPATSGRAGPRGTCGSGGRPHSSR